MQKEQFFLRLVQALRQRGVSEAAAERYVRAIAQTLTEADLIEIEQIESDEEIAQMAESIAAVKRRSAPPSDAAASSPAPIPAEAVEIPASADDEDDDIKVYSGASHAAPAPARPAYAEPEQPLSLSDDSIIGDDESTETPRGKAIFWAVLILTLPLTLALFLGYYALFGATFLALFALIILLVGALIAGVAVGAAVSLVGIVYGITQLITVSSRAPGLYEIGLGITVAGGVMFGGILVYNIAIRLIPWLIRYLAVFFRFTGGLLRSLFSKLKEVCCKL